MELEFQFLVSILSPSGEEGYAAFHEMTFALGLSFCYFSRTCGVLVRRTIAALASSPHKSAILNVFGLIMIETNPASLFQSCSE